MEQDQEHLRLLSLFHYIGGGVLALFSCVPIVHVFLGIAVLNGTLPQNPNQPQFPPEFGWFIIGAAVLFILTGWALAVGVVITGRLLAKRKYYTFCLVMAVLECLLMPFGTVLGVFTIFVLIRPSVKQLFEQQRDPVT